MLFQHERGGTPSTRSGDHRTSEKDGGVQCAEANKLSEDELNNIETKAEAILATAASLRQCLFPPP